MINYFRLGINLLRSEQFVFILGKYLSYFLIFLNSFLTAKFLGPYSYGIWGFVLLLINYLGYSNLGIQYSANVLLSTKNREDKKLLVRINSSAIILTALMGGVIVFISLILFLFDVNIFSKYNFSKYLLLVSLITMVSHFNKLFMNVFRSFGKFYQILGYLILPQIFILIMLFFSPDDEVIYYMLLGDLVGNILAVFIYYKAYPMQIIMTYDKAILNELFLRGVSLLFYNASFYFILLSSRTIVSIFYAVEDLGLFSLANNVAQAAVMILSVINFMFFPKILNRMKTGSIENDVKPLLSKIRDYYVTSSNLIVILVLLLYPLLLLFLKGYESSSSSFLFLILTQLIIVNSYGYSNLIIAKGYETKIALYAFFTVIINVIISLFLVILFKLDYHYVAFATLLSVNYYTFAVVRFGRKLLNLPFDFISVMKELFPLRIFFPFIIMMMSGFVSVQFFFLILGTVVFGILNYKYVVNSLYVFVKVMNNPNSTKF